MFKDLSISVCIASYNGELFIKQQIESIIPQLNLNDEIIISDDNSTDSTISILLELKKSFPNVNFKIINGPNMGFAQNFLNAVSQATKDIIVFCDQDDIWSSNKIKTIKQEFLKSDSITTVMHSMTTFSNLKNLDEDLKFIQVRYNKGFYLNLIKSCYWGCCMSIKKNFLDQFIPLPDNVISHDQLIGLLTEKYGQCSFIDEKLIYHRIHRNNLSKRKTSIYFRFKFRFRLIMNLIEIVIHTKLKRKEF